MYNAMTSQGICVQMCVYIPLLWCFMRENVCVFVTADCPLLVLAFDSFRQAAFT